MMKKISLIIFFIFFNGYAFAQEITPEKQNFKYKAEISGISNINSLYRMDISSEIIEKSKNNLNDLRIFDQKSNQIPFNILDEVIPADDPVYYNTIIESFNTGSNFSELIFKIDNDKPVKINKLSFDISNQDFNHSIHISSSDDSKNWKFIKKDNIYDFYSKVNLRKTEITIPPNNYKFFKVRISKDESKNFEANLELNYQDLNLKLSQSSPKDIKISSISASLNVENKDKITYDFKQFKNISVIKEKNKSVIILEAGLPINDIEFSIKDRYFSRSVQIYYKDKETKDYTLLSNDSIYSVIIGETKDYKNTISVNSGKHDLYKIEINDFDNMPLKIEALKIKWIKKNLYLIPSELNTPYELHFGNKNINKPVYDFGTFINSSNWFKQKYEKVSLGEIKEKSDFVEELVSTSEKFQKNILTFVVLIVVVVLGFFLFKMVSETRTS